MRFHSHQKGPQSIARQGGAGGLASLQQDTMKASMEGKGEDPVLGVALGGELPVPPGRQVGFREGPIEDSSSYILNSLAPGSVLQMRESMKSAFWASLGA